MIEPQKLETVNFAILTPAQMAGKALNVGKATHAALVTDSLADCDSLHMRLTTRETIDNKTTDWVLNGVLIINGGAQYSLNTVGKTATSTHFLLDSDDATREFGPSRVAPDSDDYEKDPRTWTGAVHRQKTIKIGGKTYLIEAVAACCGVQGELNSVVSGVIADSWIGQRRLQLRALHKAAA